MLTLSISIVGSHSWVSVSIFDSLFGAEGFLGAQKEFIVTDKYCKKRTIEDWGKPCIWLNNQNPLDLPIPVWKKEWLTANCIFVNLEHRLYMPEAMLPPLFIPRARLPVDPAVVPMDLQDMVELTDEEDNLGEGPSRIPLVEKGKGRAVEDYDHPVVVDGGVVYLEDLLGPEYHY